MSYQELEKLFSPLYALLGLILVVICLLTLIEFFHYYDYTLEQKNKRKVKDLEERLKTKTEMDRLKYEHEMLMKEYRDKNNDTSEN